LTPPELVVHATTAATSHLNAVGTLCPCRSRLSPLAISPFLASHCLFLKSVLPLALPLSELFGFIFFRLLILLGYMAIDFGFGIEFDLILAF
jgi:hypothetical protein